MQVVSLMKVQCSPPNSNLWGTQTEFDLSDFLNYEILILKGVACPQGGFILQYGTERALSYGQLSSNFFFLFPWSCKVNNLAFA